MKPVGAWRLLAASAVCLVSLGLVWRTTIDFGTTTTYTLPYTSIDADGWYSTVPGYTSFTYGPDGISSIHGYRSDVRVVLVPVAAVLAWVAMNRSELTKKMARAAVVGLVGLLVWAISRGRIQASAAMVVALWLVVPVVCPDWLRRLPRGRAVTPGASPSAVVQPPVAPSSTGSSF